MKNLTTLTLAAFAASLLFACHPKYEYPTTTETETNGKDGNDDESKDDQSDEGKDDEGEEDGDDESKEDDTQEEADYAVSITRVRTALKA